MPDALRDADVLVVGGGINGAGIARDLAGRGLDVVLAEQDDLARHTSSASTKLIHGGLRYLEYYEFGLVRKALAERELLLRAAPHIIRPLRFVMPHDPSMRPVWMIRAGLFLYDHLARRELLPASRTVQLARHPSGAPLKPQFTKGFVYSDGWVDDARLVVLNALDAADRGARVLTRTCVTAAQLEAADGCDGAGAGRGGGWNVTLRAADGSTSTLRTRALVNAAGPWAATFLQDALGQAQVRPLRLVKGSHIVVPRLFDHDHAYIFQNPDGRIIFAIPYEGRFTLIGTTDVEWKAEPAAVHIERDEVLYLCDQAGRYFSQPVREQDVLWSYSGVRPLLDDESGNPAAVTRDYRLELTREGGAPLLSVWGGKLTTFRKLAEEACGLLCEALGHRAADWTATAALPGGDLSEWITPSGRPEADIERFREQLALRVPQLDADTCARWARSYGALALRILAGGALGEAIVPGVHEAELRWLHTHEWARSLDDVLWRRSKLGLHLSAMQHEALAAWWHRNGLG